MVSAARVLGTWMVLGVVAACGGAAPPAEATRVAGPTCTGTAGHMVDLMASQLDPRPPDAEVNGLIELIRVRCDADRWSLEAQRCLSKMQTSADAEVCATLLTDAQQAALVRDQQQLGAPPPPTPTMRRGPVPTAPKNDAPRRTSDPCDGGE